MLNEIGKIKINLIEDNESIDLVKIRRMFVKEHAMLTKLSPSIISSLFREIKILYLIDCYLCP